MFKQIAWFESRYQFHNPVFWVVGGIFFLLTFAAMTIDNVQIGGGGNVNANSPEAIVIVTGIMSLFFMFVTTAFVANIVVRDDESGFGPMVRSTRVSKFDYLFARFTGAFFAASVAFLAVPLGMLLGSFMPWLDPETLGPTTLSHYAWAYLALALPNILLTSCLFFAVACVTRSLLLSYVGVVLFLVLYFVSTGIARSKPELRDLVATLEPFGIRAFREATRYWSPAEANTRLPAFAGALLWNRLIVLGVSLLALALAYWRYSFAERGLSARAVKKQARAQAKLASVKPLLVEQLPAPSPRAAWLPRLLSRAGVEMRLIFRSPAFFVLIVIGLTNSIAGLLFANEIYGTPAKPLTFSLIEPLEGTFSIIPLIVAIFYAGELVWRDRERGMHEIIDATSLPNWAYLVPKVLGVSAVLIGTLLISVVAAVLVQLGRGFTNIELGKYLVWYVVPNTFLLVHLAVLAVFLQALSPSKYVGWGLMVLYLIATITLDELGFEHRLYQYGSTGSNPISDINGADVGWTRAWWLRLYWSGVAVLFAIAAHLLWRRGTAVSLRSRLARAPAALRGAAGGVALFALMISVASGAYVFQQTVVVNDYVIQDERERKLAEYEKRFLQYESVRQPSATHIELQIDLYPEQGRAEFSGRYELVNDTGAPLQEIHLRFRDPWSTLTGLTLPDSTLALDELESFGYRIYRLDDPLAPGESTWLTFTAERVHEGFRINEQDTRLVRNGTFLNNAEFSPWFGFDRSELLQDRQTRRKYGLPAELRMPKLEDDSARERNYVGNADWVTSDITVSTTADQVAIAPGRRVSDVLEQGRRVAHFVSGQPILSFFSVQSARYERISRTVDGVEIEVYFHPAHDFNVERIIDSMARSLSYYREHFGPYQFDYARIIEFPGYERFAQAFAGTIPYSESIGFIANVADSDGVDYVTFVTAHEAGHQYWAHQLISADMQGGTMLVESLAQYSALMVMESIYGSDAMRRFLKYDLDRYLSERGSEAIEELPLVRVENQGYIHYRKGGHVLYLLQKRLGVERVNALLSELLDRYRFGSQPYASSKDLLAGLRALALDEREQQLVEDLLEKITLYDFKATAASVSQLPNGNFETLLTIEAEKVYADGLGNESPAPLNQSVEVGLFLERPGFGAFDTADVLLREWRDISDGEQQIRLVSKRRPRYAGVDPFTLFVDRNADDNLVAVE